MEEQAATLLVRHLPSELEDQEKIDLLCHFGAQAVRPMGTKGPMKHAAFARFSNHESAEKCLKRLHQLEVLGHKLVVQFAQSQHEKYFPSESAGTKSKSKEKDESISEGDVLCMSEQSVTKTVEDAFRKHNIPYPKKPTLYYMYPPPTVSTLTNIANALASHPKFYTQVLHLMNKMNLPCPFGPVTASPPLALDRARYMAHEKTVGKGTSYSASDGDIEEVQMEYSSTEESEIESDTESKKVKNLQSDQETGIRKVMKRPRKKMKLVQPDMSMIVKPASVQNPSELFEATSLKTAQIQFNISETDIMKQLHTASRDTGQETQENFNVSEGGFGKVEPQKSKAEVEVKKPDVNYKIDHNAFLTKRQIEEGRLKKDQIKDFSVFKNYSAGEPTSRLYIKNLTKHTTEQDLLNVFGLFVDWSQDLACDTFDIRLMKEGRMKGQAFITLPNEKEAKEIVKECNGFILNNKPIVIQFARSAKAKQVDKPIDETSIQ
ncbi:RNA-binding region-containing protein 3-like isoform X2 [Mercenaria mercenaria]|uniref:RNA-binding region-containing protein 3-like isoform X2 n=1 Tax=Mercenaria mercenaria TaxID=6596 RepID=UPI00234EE7F9|nr:RNA-binding region-containing protein 3-like isoform X2 [Mercenaria mercenaria]